MAQSTKTLAQFQSDMSAAWAGNVGATAPTASGDPLVAFFQAVAAQLIFLQAQALAAYAYARAATATGTDLDTWFADFGFVRVAGVKAQGNVTFSRLVVTASPAYIPVGTQVQTSDGTVTYQVIADTSNSNYDPVNNRYAIPANQASTAALVQALVAGASGNANVNTITAIVAAVPGVDTVNNSGAFTNGKDAESDAAARARFVTYIQGLAKATLAAITAAIQSVVAVSAYTVFENAGPGAVPIGLLGAFLVVATDAAGGTLSGASKLALAQAVDAVRAFTVASAAQAPSVVNPAIALTVKLVPGTVPSTAQTAVSTAIAAFRDALAIGATLPLLKCAQLAEEQTGVVEVVPGTLTINGVAADLAVQPYQIVRAGTINVSTTF